MGKYKVEIKKPVLKAMYDFPRRDVEAIFARIEALSENPRPFDCKKLSGREEYRIRYGNYRILYLIQDDILYVCVVQVGHRKDVYR